MNLFSFNQEVYEEKYPDQRGANGLSSERSRMVVKNVLKKIDPKPVALVMGCAVAATLVRKGLMAFRQRRSSVQSSSSATDELSTAARHEETARQSTVEEKSCRSDEDGSRSRATPQEAVKETTAVDASKSHFRAGGLRKQAVPTSHDDPFMKSWIFNPTNNAPPSLDQFRADFSKFLGTNKVVNVSKESDADKTVRRNGDVEVARKSKTERSFDGGRKDGSRRIHRNKRNRSFLHHKKTFRKEHRTSPHYDASTSSGQLVVTTSTNSS